MTRPAIAATITAAALTATGAIFLSLHPYHVGVMAGITLMCCAWALVEAIQHAGECGPRYDQALYPEHYAPPVRPSHARPLPARTLRVVRVEPPQRRYLPVLGERAYTEEEINFEAMHLAAARQRKECARRWAEFAAMEEASAADAAYYARVDADPGEWEEWEEDGD